MAIAVGLSICWPPAEEWPRLPNMPNSATDVVEMSRYDAPGAVQEKRARPEAAMKGQNL